VPVCAENVVRFDWLENRLTKAALSAAR
jgi:hypothetical protein